MFGQLEHFAGIGALTFKDGARIMQRMGQHMDLGVPPRHQLAVEPDKTVAIVERYKAHHVTSFGSGGGVWLAACSARIKGRKNQNVTGIILGSMPHYLLEMRNIRP